MYKYIVESNNLITGNIFSLRLKAKNKTDIFSFLPGQYASISYIINGKPSPYRCFSFASSPTDIGFLEFGIRIGGEFTQTMQKLKPGDEISIMGPYGAFTLDPTQNQKVVFMAGGIGITPFISMIRSAIAQKSTRNIALIYSSRNIKDCAYGTELIKARETLSNLDLTFCISDEDVSVYNNTLFKYGNITPDIINQATQYQFTNTDFYLCGPPGFMDAMKKNLLENNVKNENIITEAFSQSSEKGKFSPQKKINILTVSSMVTVMVLIIFFDAAKTYNRVKTSIAAAQNNNQIQNNLITSTAVTASPTIVENQTPTATPTQIATPSATTRNDIMIAPTQTPTPTATATPIPTPTDTSTPIPTPIPTPYYYYPPVTGVS